MTVGDSVKRVATEPGLSVNRHFSPPVQMQLLPNHFLLATVASMSKRRTQRHSKTRQADNSQAAQSTNSQAAGPEDSRARFTTPIILLTIVLVLGLFAVSVRRGWLFGTTTESRDGSTDRAISTQSLEGLTIEELEDKLDIPALGEIPERGKTIDIDAWTAQLDEACAGLKSSYPSDAKAEHLYGLIQLRLKRTKSAEPSLRRAVELSPANLQMRADLADLLMQLGQDEEALQVLVAANATEKSSVTSLEYYLLLADCQARNGDLESSEATLVLATQVAPRDAAAWLRLAKVQLQQRNSAQAESSVRKAIKQNSTNAEAWQVLHQALKLQRRDDESKAALEQWNKYKSQNRVRDATTFDDEMASSMTKIFGSCFRSLAVLYESNGNKKVAQSMYQRAIWANPRDTSAILGWTNMLRSAGDFRTAIELNRRLVRLQPDEYLNYQNVANLSMELSRPRDAEAALRLACRRMPENGNAHLVLANFLLFLNKPGEAKAPANRAKQLLGTSESESLVNRIQESLSTSR